MKAHLEGAFEAEVVAHLTSPQGGWSEGAADSYRRDLGLDTSDLFAFLGATQIEAWEKLVGLHGSQETAQKKFAKRLADELTARGTVDVLRNGVTDLGVKFHLLFPAPAHELTPEIRDLYEGNRCTVTRQVHHSESKPQDAVDLTLFVNGIPVATAELKTQTAGQDVADAVHQYRADRNPADLVFANRTLVHFAVDSNHVEMTTKLAGEKTVFLPFNQGSGGPGNEGGKGNPNNPAGHASAYLWQVVWARDTWLDLLAAFVHVHRDEAPDPATGKKVVTRRTLFPRYHQWHAVRRLLDTARVEGPGTAKLIQHSAGSGKSNTIAWLAHGLSRLHTPHDLSLLLESARAAGLGPDEPVFDKTVIITDRRNLDKQLRDTVTGFSHTPGAIAAIDENMTSKDLRAALESKAARIVITTLQKFSVVAQAATELAGTRFAVIVDEAHSSQSGEAAKDLKAVLGEHVYAEALASAQADDPDGEAVEPGLDDLLAASVAARGRQSNLTFFAFTATPKAKTLELFGEAGIGADGAEVRRPFHLYSMRRAIEEGYIHDVLANYTTYSTYYRLANNLGGEVDPELPKGKAASQLARFVSLHPSNLAQKTEVIVEHFRAHTRTRIGGHAKAMVVTRSRIHAVRYHQAIGAYLKEKGYDTGPDAMRALVAFSGSLTDPDNPGVEYREALLNGFGEKELPGKFAGTEFQVLVVAEKYQTGFDQPLLHTMYVDKKLASVKAVQTLSRLNRTHPGKTDTFVLDFANSAEEIVEAFAPYYTQTTATPTDPNVLYNLSGRIHATGILDAAEIDAGVAAILRADKGSSAALNAAIDPAVERFGNRDEQDQDEFRDALNGFVRAYSFLGQVVPFTDPGLEKLFYYGKFLLAKLPTHDSGGTVDLSGAVVLTHLRTDLVAANQVLSLGDEPADPLTSHTGEGRGGQPEVPMSLLSQLIASLNDRFGANLGEADRIFFDQQSEHMYSDDDVREVALTNDLDQFTVYLRPKIEDKILERHEGGTGSLS
ncbi:MAG: type I restriction endonuclease subunit R [Sporichthyaceae bacterium]